MNLNADHVQRVFYTLRESGDRTIRWENVNL